MRRRRRLVSLSSGRHSRALLSTVALVAAPAFVSSCGDRDRQAPPAEANAYKPAVKPDPHAQATFATSNWLAKANARVRASEYVVRREAGKLAAFNRSQGLRVSWTDSRLSFGEREVTSVRPLISMEATALSVAGEQRRLVKTAFAPNACSGALPSDQAVECQRRVERKSGPVTEWWENRPDGVQHGFVVADRPARRNDAGGWLGVEVRVEGATIDLPDHSSTAILTTAGGKKYSYSGLLAWDVNKKRLPTRMRRASRSIWLEVDDSGATYPVTIDPILTKAAWTVTSGQLQAGLQSYVAGVGDVNGDGYDDIGVSHPYYDGAAGANEGLFLLYLGRAAGLLTTPDWTSSGANAQGVPAATADAMFGFEFTGSDVNGDGFSDLIISQPRASRGQSMEGLVYVFHGAAGVPSSQPAVVIEGDAVDAKITHLRTADLNVDGYADVVIGAPQYDAPNGVDVGRISIHLGGPSGLSRLPADVMHGLVTSGKFGQKLAAADVDGNGREELIVGACGANIAGQLDGGAAYAYAANPDGTLNRNTVWSTQGIAGQNKCSVAGLGDVNGDGYGDVAVGAALQDRVYFYMGSSTGLPQQETSLLVGDHPLGGTFTTFGNRVAGVGDVNGDGYADIAISAPFFGRPNYLGAVFLVAGSPQPLPAVLPSDPTKPPFVSIGTLVQEELGWTMGAAGDVNGDGFADLLVGAREEITGGEHTALGRAHLFLGSPDITGDHETVGWMTPEPNRLNAALGKAVSAGDFNGDGFADVVVASPDHFAANDGNVFIYHGAEGGTSSTAAWSLASSLGAVGFGKSVSSGDVNGDGYADLVVGAPDFSSGRGRVYVYMGTATGIPAGATPLTRDSTATNGRLGTSVATADVNGDGYADVVGGVPGYASGQANEGRLAVYLGAKTGLGTTLVAVESNVAGARLGTSVAFAGDVDRDGRDDVVAGAPGVSNPQSNEGRIYVYRGTATGLNTTTTGWTVEANIANAALGTAVSGAGDTNGDGFADIAGGAPGVSNPQPSEGRIYVVRGGASALGTVWTYESDTDNAMLGQAVGAGDFNSDGRADIVAGSPQHAGAGRVYKFLTRSDGTLPTIFSSTVEAGAAGWQLGAALVMGDINGDGISDLLMGAPGFGNVEAGEGRALVQMGNGRGRGFRLRSQNPGATGIVQAGGGVQGPGTAFQVAFRASSPAGRSRVKLEIEVKARGTAFNGTGTLVDSVFTEVSGTGTDLVRMVRALSTQTAYHYRARLHYATTTSPLSKRSRWFYGGRLGDSGGTHVRTRGAFCQESGVAAGTPCDDGNLCTQGGVCSGGSCTAGTTPSCADTNSCTADTCEPVRGCRFAPQVGAQCADDGIACNGAETCTPTGTCASALKFAGACAPGWEIQPQVTCVIPRGGSLYTAVFGYTNAATSNVHLPPLAGSNAMSPGPVDQGQPHWFKGKTTEEPSQPLAFAVDFESAVPSWTVGSRTVTATAAPSGACTLDPNGEDGLVVRLPPGPGQTQGPSRTIVLDPARIAGNARRPTVPPAGTTLVADTTRAAVEVTHDGAAVTEIPIVVPTGRRGLQPNLSLSYGSQAGSGLAGVGWSIRGLSEIRVCRTTIRQDGTNRPLRLDGKDPLCLDGQRLLEVKDLNLKPSPPAKAFRAPGVKEIEYRTERTDGRRIISRAVSGDVPSYFEVATRDGRILTYGIHLSYAQIDADDTHHMLGKVKLDTLAAPRTFSWPLTQIRDRFGNRMDIRYDRGNLDFDHREYDAVPKEIIYTGHGSLLGRRRVVFNYVPRLDPTTRVLAFQDQTGGGHVVERFNRILDRIDTSVDTGAGGGPTVVRYYRLQHTRSGGTGRSLLETVQECEAGTNGTAEAGAGDDVCKRPIQFIWDHGVPAFQTIQTGIVDALQTGAEKDHAHLTTGDFNGDGQADILYAFKQGGLRKHALRLSNAGFFRSTATRDDLQQFPQSRSPFLGVIEVDTSLGYQDKTRFLTPWFHDIDGDDRAEILVPVSENPGLVNPKYTYAIFRSAPSSSTGAFATQAQFPDLPGLTLSPLGSSPIPVVALPKYLPNLLVIPLDLHGDRRPGLAVLEDNAVFIPRGEAGAIPFERWRCEFHQCNGTLIEQPCHTPTAVCEPDPETGVTPVLPSGNYFKVISWCFDAGSVSGSDLDKSCRGSCTNACVPGTYDDLPFSRPVTAAWQYRAPTGVGQPLPSFVSPDIRLKSIGTRDDDGDGIQQLGEVSFLSPKGDFNGDGLQETYRNDGRNYRVVDFDGDGDSDVVELTSTGKLRVDRAGVGPGAGWVSTEIDVPVGHPVTGTVVESAQFKCDSTVTSNAIDYESASPQCMLYPNAAYCLHLLSKGAMNCRPTGQIVEKVNPPPEYKLTQVLDWNGDGLMDIISPDATTRELVLHVRKGNRPDVLIGVKDGFQVETSIDWAPLSDRTDLINPLFTPETGDCTYPFQCMKTSKWVVRGMTRKMEAPAGAGRPSRSTSMSWRHSYAGGRTDLLGRGWLGFAEHKVVLTVGAPPPDTNAELLNHFVEETTVTKFEHALTLDQNDFPLSRVPTTVSRTTVGLGGQLFGTLRVVEHRVVRGAAASQPRPGAPQVQPLPAVAGAPPAWVLDFVKDSGPYYTHPFGVTETEYEAPGAVTPFHASSAKKKTVTQVVQDVYGNVQESVARVYVAASPGAGVSSTALVTSEVDIDYDGDNGAIGAPFEESRFLGLSTLTTKRETYGARPEVIIKTRQVFTPDQGVDGVPATLVVQPDGPADETLSTTTDLNEYGLPKEIRATGSGQTRVSQVFYDALEGMYPERTVNPADHEAISFFHRGLDAKVWTRDANGIVTRTRIDGFGRLLATDGPMAADETRTYGLTDISTPQVTTTSPSGAVLVQEFDEHGREIVRRRQTADGSWADMKTRYDTFGRVQSVGGPYGEATSEYDALGRLVHQRRMEDVLGPTKRAVVSHLYSHFKVTTLEGDQTLGSSGGTYDYRKESHANYDGVGQIVEKGEKLGGRTITTTYEYGAFGRLMKVQQGPAADEVATEMDYDALGRRKFLSTPDNGDTTTLYNGFGEIREENGPDGRKAVMTPDALGRVIVRDDTKDGVTTQTRFDFDVSPGGIGGVGRGTSPEGVVTQLTYDPVFGAAAGRSVAIPGVNGGQALSTNLTFDDRGRAFELTYPTVGAHASPLKVIHDYFPNGELESVATGTDVLWKALERDALGRAKQEQYDDGAVLSVRDYWPSTGRLKSIVTGGGVVQNIGYHYYSSGDLRSRTDGGTHEGFVYDELGRLKIWQEVAASGWPGSSEDQGRATDGWRVAYDYDDRGNLKERLTTKLGTAAPLETVTQTYAEGAAGPNRLSTSTFLGSGQQFVYDGAGNVTGHPVAGTITYTPFNLPKTTSGGPGPISYVYDAFGVRVLKKETAPGAAVQTAYVGDLYEQRIQGADTVHAMLVFAEGRVIAQIRRGHSTPTEEVSYVFSDRLGSAEVIRNPGGTMEVRRRDPFGNVMPIVGGRLTDVRLAAAPALSGGPHAVTKGFTGHEDDRELGLVNMGGRIYDPRIGRFLQGDPLVSAPYNTQGHNRYTYVINNPLSFKDPSGFDMTYEESQCALFHECNFGFEPPPTEPELEQGNWLLEGRAQLDAAEKQAQSARVAAEEGNTATGCGAGPAGAAACAGMLTILATPHGLTPEGARAQQEMQKYGHYSLMAAGAGWLGLRLAVALLPTRLAPPLLLAGGAAGSRGDSIRLYHGSVGNYSSIMRNGLDPTRIPTWVTTSPAAAQNAIGAGRVLSPGQGLDRGIIQSVVPRLNFERLIQSGAISPTRNWPGFGGGTVFPENVLRMPEAIELFNRGMMP
jgi:RHS repeat-associated protein